MSKIKLAIHRGKPGNNKKALSTGIEAKRLFSFGAAGVLLLSVLATALISFPQKAFADTGTVTITDKVTYNVTDYPNGVPLDVSDTVDINSVPDSGSGPYAAFLPESGASAPAKSVSINGHVATFTATFNSVTDDGLGVTNGKIHTPIPSGNYVASSGIGGGKVNFKVNKQGNGSATISGTALSPTQIATNYGDFLSAGCPAGESQSQCAANFGGIGKGTPDPCATGAKTDANGNACKSSLTCESSGFSLSWIVCPIINGLSDAVDGIYGNFIQPLLITKPIDITGTGKCQLGGPPSDPTAASKGDYLGCDFKVWADFRTLGDIFLLIALMVVVFGQSIGGGLIDAYAAKKILPRLLIAAILINLSIYIVAAAVDITNVLGAGVQNLIEAPIANAGAFHLTLSGGTSAAVSFAGILGGAGVVGTIWAAIATGGAVLVPLIAFVALFILLPAILLFLSILITVLLRRAVIIFLVLSSPVALALYCLPNTEKYFRRWLDLFMRTLLVYPIIAGLFALGSVMSVFIQQGASTSGGVSFVGQILSIISFMVPLFLIPFAFKLSGGILGKVHEGLQSMSKRGAEAIKGNINDPNSLRNRTKRNMGDANTRMREYGVGTLSNVQKGKGNRLKRGAAGRLGRLLNYGDLELKRSAINKEEGEQRALKTGFGPDSSVRALFAVPDENNPGVFISPISGKKYSGLEVAAAKRLSGRNQGAAQAAMDYELGKAGNDEEYQRYLARAPEVLESLGYDQSQIDSVMIGVGYNNQAKRLDLKHSKFKKDPTTEKWTRTVDHQKLAQDAAENFGSYPMSNMKTSPINELRQGYINAQKAIEENDFGKYNFADRAAAERTMADVKSSAETLDMRRQRGQIGEEDGSPVGMSGAPGHVAQSIENLLNTVNPGRLNPPSRGGGGTPPPTVSGGPNRGGVLLG